MHMLKSYNGSKFSYNCSTIGLFSASDTSHAELTSLLPLTGRMLNLFSKQGDYYREIYLVKP
jgi:hypothetical protein